MWVRENTTLKCHFACKNTASSFLPRSMTGGRRAVLAQQLQGCAFAAHHRHSTLARQKPFPFRSQLRYGSMMPGCSAQKPDLGNHLLSAERSSACWVGLLTAPPWKPRLISSPWHHTDVGVANQGGLCCFAASAKADETPC